MNNPKIKIHIGNFGAERYFCDKNKAVLPSFKDEQSDRIVSVMDELQFVFCTDVDDLLFTRFKLDNYHLEYLNNIGFKFNSYHLFEIINKNNIEKNIFECLLEQKSSVYPFNNLESKISAYMLDPYCCKFIRTKRFKSNYPRIETVKKINSKFYSHELLKNINPTINGKIIKSSEELYLKGKEFLKSGSFLIKAPFGVSGKGNILISNIIILERIVKFLNQQELNGKICEFLLEPLYNKEIDFSCQLEISSCGEYQIVSLNIMNNRNFSFNGITQINESLKKCLDKCGYFDTVNTIVNSIYKDGYFGPLGIDSMLCKDGTVIPIIEFNARKTMGQIYHYLNKSICQDKANSELKEFSLGINKSFNYKSLLEKIREKNLLYLNKSEINKIIPLSSNTLNVNLKFNSGLNDVVKGKLYVFLIYKNIKDRERMINGIFSLLKELNIKIYS